jgi:hypothetical protein
MVIDLDMQSINMEIELVAEHLVCYGFLRVRPGCDRYIRSGMPELMRPS